MGKRICYVFYPFISCPVSYRVHKVTDITAVYTLILVGNLCNRICDLVDYKINPASRACSKFWQSIHLIMFKCAVHPQREGERESTDGKAHVLFSWLILTSPSHPEQNHPISLCHPWFGCASPKSRFVRENIWPSLSSQIESVREIGPRPSECHIGWKSRETTEIRGTVTHGGNFTHKGWGSCGLFGCFMVYV